MSHSQKKRVFVTHKIAELRDNPLIRSKWIIFVVMKQPTAHVNNISNDSNIYVKCSDTGILIIKLEDMVNFPSISINTNLKKSEDDRCVSAVGNHHFYRKRKQKPFQLFDTTMKQKRLFATIRMQHDCELCKT